VLIVRGTRKLRDRVKGPSAAEHDRSTTTLGDWFATAVPWRPQVALLVNERTMVPVLLPLAPSASLLERIPAAIETILRLHGVDEEVLAAERTAMVDVRLAPTNNRSVVGVMNEFAFLGDAHRHGRLVDLESLSLRLARVPLGPLRGRTGFPDKELAAFLGTGAPPERLAAVIPFPSRVAALATTVATPPFVAVYQLRVTLQGTKPPIWRRMLIAGSATLDQVHEVLQAAFGWWNCHLHEFEVGRLRYGVPDPHHDRGVPVRDERVQDE